MWPAAVYPIDRSGPRYNAGDGGNSPGRHPNAGAEAGPVKILITGATGFIGRNLAERLHEDGHRVRATGRSTAVGGELRAQGIEFVPADLRDTGQVAAMMAPVDCVVHCAARAGPWGERREFFEANVLATRNVLAECRRLEIPRIVFFSSPSVYFDGTDRLDIRESDPLPERQLSSYGETKRIAEVELLEQAGTALRAIVFRPRAVFGPHDNAIIPRVLRLAEKRRVPLIDGGRAFTVLRVRDTGKGISRKVFGRIDVTAIDNLVDAVRRALAAPADAWNEVYNLSNGDPVMLRDWFAEILAALGRPFRPRDVPAPVAMVVAAILETVAGLRRGRPEPSLNRFTVGYMARSMTLSIVKARTKLGYHPSVTRHEALRRYAEWHRGGSGRGRA